MSRDPKPRAGATSFGMRNLSVFALAAWLSASTALAQVTEPNGLVVPVVNPQSSEVTLQRYFDGRMPAEPIDALRQASPEPATFSPRCGFEAELVLSESSARAGLAWYNVPSDPNAPPAQIFKIMEETTETGAVVSSSQIRSDPNYTGGSIGFALTKNGGMPIYYSEASRNALCNGCVMPDHWKLMLAYPSQLEATTYYLAWEDWEGANENSWPDDGDFNDKVFRLSGVRCAGGGEPCETGKLGVCAQGLTGCSTGIEPGACVQLEAASTEVCDGLDNDCDGQIDDDRPCGSEGACVNGACVQACGGVEFPCPDSQVCDEGECVDPMCVGVNCPEGQLCDGGLCKLPCEGVVCPLGQVCRSGVCKDPCAAVSCDAGSVCRLGACLESCLCSGCADGLACDAGNGSCVDAGCIGVSCAAGQACQKGACVDACEGAVCPRGAECRAGQCSEAQAPPRSQAPMAAPHLVPVGAAGMSGSSSATVTEQPTPPRAQPRSAQPAAAGCGCRVAEPAPSAHWPLAFAGALLFWLKLRRKAVTRRCCN